MEVPSQLAHIKGWGIDADPHNDPTYPMRRREEGQPRAYTWGRPAQQPQEEEVLHSNERPNLSATFGTSSPPSGLSGLIRRFAFKYSESSYAHWLPLMLADRINMVEGVLRDLAEGRVPNIPRELGWGGEWKFNRQGLIRRLIGGAVVAAIIAALVTKRDD